MDSQELILIQAIINEDVDKVAEILSENEIDINQTDTLGTTFLHKAVTVESPNLEIVKLLLAKENININIQSVYYGHTPLHSACINEKISKEVVEALVKKDVSTVNVVNYHKTNALHYACWYNRLDIVKILVENGADVNYLNLIGETCLFALYGEIMEYLLDNTQIDAKVKNRDGNTVLMVLLDDVFFDDDRNQSLELYERLIHRTFDIDPITKSYKFDDFFVPTLKACSNSSTGALFLKKLYSENNSMYHLIERLEKHSFKGLANAEFRFGLYALVHDELRNPSFNSKFENQHEFQYILKSSFFQLPFILNSIKSDELNELVLELFEYLHSIGFYRNDSNFQSFNRMLFSYSLIFFRRILIDFNSYKRFYNILKFFHLKGNKEIFQNYSASAGYLEDIKIASTVIPFAQDIKSVLGGTEERRSYYQMIVDTYGDFGMGAKKVFSLKHICRNRIRKTLNQNYPDCTTFFEKLNSMTCVLPRRLVRYLRFDELYGED